MYTHILHACTHTHTLQPQLTSGVKAYLYILKCRKYVLMAYSVSLRTSSTLKSSMLWGGLCRRVQPTHLHYVTATALETRSWIRNWHIQMNCTVMLPLQTCSDCDILEVTVIRFMPGIRLQMLSDWYVCVCVCVCACVCVCRGGWGVVVYFMQGTGDNPLVWLPFKWICSF